MKKIALGLLTAVATGTSFGATVNVTSTGNYTTINNYTNCTTVPASACANFLTTHNVSGTFTTAGPLPANANNQEIGSTVTSYSFANGLDTVASTDTNARLNSLRISTDASGNITNVNSMQAVQWTTGPIPHDNTSRFNAVTLAGANGAGTHNSACQTLGTGNSGVADTCVQAVINDTSRSTGLNSPVSYSMAQTPPVTGTAAPVPTMSEWALLLMTSLLGLFGAARLRRKG